MNFKYSKNLSPCLDTLSKINSISWSPNLMRLAVAQSSDKKIALFDEQGNKKDIFSTKPFKNKKYMIRDIQFSPCSTKLAIAISDNMVFVYNLGAKWGDRKTICNKFEQEAPVTSMIWPSTRKDGLIVGLANGKIKEGVLHNNSVSTLYTTDNYVVSLAASLDGKFLLSGHLDGIIYKFNFENSNLQKLVIHPCIPYCLSLGVDIVVSGNDSKVVFYNDIGTTLQTFDYSHDEKLKEFTTSRMNANGDCVCIGNYNKFFIFLYNSRKLMWEEACIKYLEGLYSVTALTWKPDGSALVTGNLTGSVDLFEAYIKKQIFKDRFEITYVSHSQVVIKNRDTQKRLIIKPSLSNEITHLKIYLDNFIVMATKESLVLGDIDSEKQSEIGWNFNSNEKFDFSNPNVCMIYNAGELTLVEYGNNEILGYCRTEYIHTRLISTRLNYNLRENVSKLSTIKIIAYLIDLNTIMIHDLCTQTQLNQITHDEKVDLIQLNKNGNKLIFRDRKKHLYLYHVFEGKKSTLLNYCGFVSWVPNSEVLVAQDRKNMCIWYNVEDPDKVKVTAIKGEITEIIRRVGKTEVLVNEGTNTQTYLLDDGLIGFNTAIDENDLNKAVSILEQLEMNSDTETHWKTLAKHAIVNKKLLIARRCYAAIGSYSKASYIEKVSRIAEEHGLEHPLVEARLLILDKQFNNAENLLLQNNLLDEAMEILNELQKWDESVRIAEKYGHPSINEIKNQYYNWLLENDQLDKAAEMKEKEGDYDLAIKHYITGGYPAKAANLVKTYDISRFDSNTLENIVKSLMQVGIFEKAGEILEQMGHYKRSLECYQKGNCYSKAVELAKKHMTNIVEKLEEEWGDYLSMQKHNEAAIIHYIEANAKDKAIEAAISARKWDKAVDLVNNTPFEIAKPYYADIGDHFAVLQKLDTAEKYYLKAKEPILALNMYVRFAKWDKAEQVAKKHLKDNEYKEIITKEAEQYETRGKLKEAEKLYIIAEEEDIAINMYKQAKQYDHMIRLVSKYRPDYLKDTHLMVASLLEKEQNPNLKHAEMHYLEASAWKLCSEMYKNHNMWEEALRVAKSYGTKQEVNERAMLWVQDLPKDQARKKLLSMGLIDACIDLESNQDNFDEAFKLAEQHARYKLPDVHLKYAMKLEDEKKYHDAEEHYIKADQVHEVIQMYEHIHEYNSALRIARQHNPESVPNIYLNQAKFHLEKQDYPKAELCFMNGKRPDLMVKEYMKMEMYEPALKYSKKYYPPLAEDIEAILDSKRKPFKDMSAHEIIEGARQSIDSGNYPKAIEYFLELNQGHISQVDKLSEYWEKAVNIAMEYDRKRATDVVIAVASKMQNVGIFDKAGLMFENVGQVEDAADCYIEANLYDQAHKLIETMREGETKKRLQVKLSKVSGKKILPEDPNELAKELENQIQIGDYDKCLSMAMKQSDELFNKYLINIVKKFLVDKNLSGAADFLAKYHTPIYKYNLDLYKELAEEILAEENLDELRSLKDMLFCCLKQLVNHEEFTNELKHLARLHKIAYYQFLKFTMKQNPQNFPKSYYLICMCVLSYGDIIKLDLGLLDAGVAARDANEKANAFILLNRYIDLYEIIEDPNVKLEFEKEFEDTEIPQSDIFRSEVNILSHEKKEELLTWIVKASVDKNLEKRLTRRECPKCKKKSFECNLVCPSCHYTYDQCVVTGYPINTQSETVTCSNCKKKALTECWKEWISQKEICPWCGSVQMSYK